ncbi:hypothetical protein KW783_02805 [Candidatus Parcubacteria bacterium]|nr:hypothetical protein [Candidatus Parcubacteria bacterium]
MYDQPSKKPQIGNLQAKLVVKIIQKIFPHSKWANDFGNDNIGAKLFFIVLIPALIIALFFIIFIQLGYIK